MVKKFTKNMDNLKTIKPALDKLVRVVASCNTEEQMVTAYNMIQNYIRKLKFQGVINPETIELYLRGAYDLQELKLWNTNPATDALLSQILQTEDNLVINTNDVE